MARKQREQLQVQEKQHEINPNNKRKKEEKKKINKLDWLKLKVFGSKKAPKSTQQTIPYIQMLQDGICQTEENKYNKVIAFNDINYQLANRDDQNLIFEKYCEFLNFFDASITVQLLFVNRYGNPIDYEASIKIPGQGDGYDDVRKEYEEMLRNQLTKGNNGLIKYKYIVFGIETKKPKEAKTRLERMQNDILNNFKQMGVMAYPLSGTERLEALHGQMHVDGREKFHMDWKDITEGGMNTKDFIAPTSFDFGNARNMGVGNQYVSTGFLNITAPNMSDKLLSDYLNLDVPLTITIHFNALEQQEAIRMVKRKLTSINALKVEEQKKANRAGYDMDIMSADIMQFSKETEEFLNELQSNNERMFIMTFLIQNTAPSKQKLDDYVFTSSGIAQKYNCTLKRLDYQQEQAYISTLALGMNQIQIKRTITTSSIAIFVPFTTCELFMKGQSLYYGLNALSNNLIMADRKELKNPKGLYNQGRFCVGEIISGERSILPLFAAYSDRAGMASVP